jgi:uncharacterized protein (TIGR04141 family)
MDSLTVFKIVDGLEDPDKIIAGRDKLAYSPVTMDGQRIGDMYAKRSVREQPTWLRYFGNSIDLPIPTGTASLSAVVLIKEGSSLFALVFGYGRSLVNEDAIERRFGLRATLNAVEPSKLRSIEHKRLDAISRHTREQLSKAGALEQFGLDTDRDMLRGVTGEPTEPIYGKTLTGGDQLTVLGELPLKSVKESLGKYSALAEKKTYTENFPWVDNVRDIRDASLRSALDAELLKQIKRGAANCWLAPPEVIDWSTTAGFAYSHRKTADRYPDMDLDTFFDWYGSRPSFTVADLTQSRIYHIRSDTEAGQHSWRAIDCFVADCDYKGRRYVLNEGLWYEIEPNFLETIKDFIENIPKSAISFLPYLDKDGGEGFYNSRIARRSRGSLALLDQNFINYPRRGKVEVCDLFSSNKVFIHVKRMAASSTLSHLFAQGTVSGELMVHEPGFRKQFYEKIPASHRWGNCDDQINPRDFEICFAIVARPGKPLALPFFSQVSLRTAVRTLKQLGYKVSLAEIQSS